MPAVSKDRSEDKDNNNNSEQVVTGMRCGLGSVPWLSLHYLMLIFPHS